MSLPDLSGMSVRDDLFNHLSKRDGGKDKCNRHKEPVENKEDEVDNCAIEGYLMYREVEDTEVSPENYYGKVINVDVQGSELRLLPNMKRSKSAAAKLEDFKINHKEWVDRVFPMICYRGDGLLPVQWESYGKELMKLTEWYYLDPLERGQLFVAFVNTASRRAQFHLPNVGRFASNVLYISLVCSVTGSGFGKQMMALANEAARKLGCESIVLSSLSNSAGFYYSLGYRFISKLDGQTIDVKPYLQLRPGKDGVPKLFLNPNPPNPPDPPGSGPRKPKRGREDVGKSGIETTPYDDP